MYGKPIENEIKRVKHGNETSGEFLLTKEELAELVKKAKNGEDEAKERIWTTHLLFLVKKISTSKYVGGTSCASLDPNEALGMTWDSLLAALKSYNGSSSFSFWWWNKCKIDLETEYRRRCKNHEREPLLSDLFTNAYLDDSDGGEFEPTGEIYAE